MLREQRDHSLGDGVYFAPTDYIGVGRRLLILCVDAVTIFLLGWGLSAVWFDLLGISDGFICALVVGGWLYLVPLKRSVWRTVGYRLAGAKLVNLQGEQPALWSLTIRSMLWIFWIAPGNFLFDLLWCGVDGDRQSIRDRIANTCLVKNNAIPVGTGEVHLAHYFALGYMLVYSHVVHPNAVSMRQDSV